MTGLVRKATFFVACATILGVAAAYAGVVSPGNCSVGGTRINLVGFNSAAPGDKADSVSTNAKITITVRDVSNNPIPGIPVVLDFSGCVSDVKVASSASQSYHAIATGCATATVQGYSTANGTVSFVVVGGRSAATSHAVGCAKVYADSYLLGSISVGTYDQNNAGGVNGADLSLFGIDLFGGLNPDRSDYNGDLVVNGADLSLFGACLFGGRSGSSGATLCP
jgi:hypothetical protein